MSDSVKLLLKMARKSFLGADYRQACEYSRQAKEKAQGRDWLESQKYLMSSSRELMDSFTADQIKNELQAFLPQANDDVKSLTYYLLAQWFAYRGEWAVAKSHIELSLESALKEQNKDDVAFALFGIARIDTYLGQYDKAVATLEKLDLVLSSRPNTDVEISLQLLKAHIFTKTQRHTQAIQQAWTCYELAKEHGYFNYIPIVLSALASLYVDNKSYHEAQVYLSLAEKGVTLERQPFLHQFLESEKIRLGKVLPKSDYDLVVDLKTRHIYERSKGVIDFKNQHTLLDLALLFLKNPQKPFSKEMIIKLVWGHEYQPETHDNLIYVNMKRLRTLLEPDEDRPKYFVRGRQGYYFSQSHSVQFKNEDQAV